MTGCRYNIAEKSLLNCHSKNKMFKKAKCSSYQKATAVVNLMVIESKCKSLRNNLIAFQKSQVFLINCAGLTGHVRLILKRCSKRSLACCSKCGQRYFVGIIPQAPNMSGKLHKVLQAFCPANYQAVKRYRAACIWYPESCHHHTNKSCIQSVNLPKEA